MKAVLWVVGIIAGLIILGSLRPVSETESRGSESLITKWYQGGTLHESTIREWNAATYDNQLATAADWTTSVIGQDEFERIGLNGVRVKAGELVKCIKGSTDELEGVGALSTMEIGAACITLMKW